MLRRNLIANYLGQGWAAIISLAFVPLYIEYLGIEAYGLIGLFTLLQTWLSLFDMGMTPTLGREMSQYAGGGRSAEFIRDLLRSIEILAIGIAFVILIAVWSVSGWLANDWLEVENLPIDTLTQAIVLMGGVVSLRLIEGIYRSGLIGLQCQVLYNAINSAMATVRGIGAVAVLAWVSPTIQAFFFWQGLVSLVTLASLAFATYLKLPVSSRVGRYSLDALRSIFGFARGIVGITFLSLLLTQVDKILLSKLLDLSEYGYYTLAGLVASLIFILMGPITQAWFPRLSQLHASNDRASLTRTFHQGAQLVTVIMGSVAIVLIFFSESILHLWTQNAELARRTSILVSLLALGNLLNGLVSLPYQTQLAYGCTGLLVRINICYVLIIVPAILWVAPRYGGEGTAWVWVGLNAGNLLIGAHFMFRNMLTAEKWRWYLKDIAQPITAALLVAYLLAQVSPLHSSSNWVQFGWMVLVCSLIFSVAVLSADLIRDRVFTEIRLLVMRLKAPSI